jgi:hypothetical protein
MTVRTLVLLASVLVSTANVVADQPPPAAPQTAPAPRAVMPPQATTPAPTPVPTPATKIAAAAPAPRRTGQPVNIKIDITISDSAGGTAAPTAKKTVSVVTGDNMSGFIRTEANYAGGPGNVFLNIDVEPEILADGKIRTRVNLQYDMPGAPPNEGGGRVPFKTQIRENLALILENGKALVASQSADPALDRQVTIEVKATILR